MSEVHHKWASLLYCHLYNEHVINDIIKYEKIGAKMLRL